MKTVDPLLLALKDARLEANLYQRELAGRALIRQQTISKLENGEDSPTLDTIRKVLNSLGLDVKLVKKR